MSSSSPPSSSSSSPIRTRRTKRGILVDPRKTTTHHHQQLFTNSSSNVNSTSFHHYYYYPPQQQHRQQQQYPYPAPLPPHASSFKKCLSDGDLSTLITRCSTTAVTNTSTIADSSFDTHSNNNNNNHHHNHHNHYNNLTVSQLTNDGDDGDNNCGENNNNNDVDHHSMSSASSSSSFVPFTGNLLLKCNNGDQGSGGLEVVDATAAAAAAAVEQYSAAATDEMIIPSQHAASISADTIDDFDDDDDNHNHNNHETVEAIDDHLLPEGIPSEVLVINEEEAEEKDCGVETNIDRDQQPQLQRQPKLVTHTNIPSTIIQPMVNDHSNPTTSKIMSTIGGHNQQQQQQQHHQQQQSQSATMDDTVNNQFRMYEDLVRTYRQKLQSSEELNDSLHDYLRQTQGYADELLLQRQELIEILEQMESNDNTRNDQEIMYLVLTLGSLALYILDVGGESTSHQFLVAAIVLQLLINISNMITMG